MNTMDDLSLALGNDVWLLVFGRLPTPTLVAVSEVCRQWNQIIRQRFPKVANLVALYRTAERLSEKHREIPYRQSGTRAGSMQHKIEHLSLDVKKPGFPYPSPSRTITHCVGEKPIDPRTHFVQKNGRIVFPPVVVTGEDLLPFRSFHHGKENLPKKPNSKESSSEGIVSNTGWGNLTKDVLSQIFQHLINTQKDERDLVSLLKKVNTHWNAIADSSIFWLVLYLKRYKNVDSVIPLQVPINCKVTPEKDGATHYTFFFQEQQHNMPNLMKAYYSDRRTIEYLHKSSKTSPDTNKLSLFVLDSSMVIHADVYKLKEVLVDEYRLESLKQDTRKYLWKRCETVIRKHKQDTKKKTQRNGQ